MVILRAFSIRSLRVRSSPDTVCTHFSFSSRRIQTCNPNRSLNSCSTLFVLYHDLISMIPGSCRLRMYPILVLGSIKFTFVENGLISLIAHFVCGFSLPVKDPCEHRCRS